MSSFSQRWLCVFGAFVMATVFVISGCTDAMVGPADADATDNRVVETAGEAMLQQAEPVDAGDSHGVRGRLARRFFLPLPDTLEAPDSSGTAPSGRLRLPYAMPPPIALPPPTGTPPDSSGVPPDSTCGGAC